MSEVTTFSSLHFGNLRTLDVDGKPHFVAKDVAEALGYGVARKAVFDHCKGVLKRNVPTNGGAQAMAIIPESDLYRLIMRSKLPSAERFQDWVTEEVLPTLRETGSYQVHAQEPVSQAQYLLTQAQLMVDIEKRQVKQEATLLSLTV